MMGLNQGRQSSSGPDFNTYPYRFGYTRCCEKARHKRLTRVVSAWNIWLCVAAFVFTAAHAYALDPNRLISQYGHTVWRSEEGLVPPSAEITQTADGFIWIGSNTDLWRFDGAQFIRWTPPKGAESLSTINCLYGAKDGSLWIGMVSGLIRVKGEEVYSYTKPSDRFGISNIIEDDAGTIWMTRYQVPHNEGGLCKVAGSGLRCYDTRDGMTAPYGIGMAKDRSGDLWIAGGKLFRWRPGTNASQYLDAENQPKVRDVAADPSGDVWAALAAKGPRAGVQYFHNGVWGDFTTTGFNSSGVLAGTLFVDSAGAVWIGTTDDGVYRVWKGGVDHFSKNDGLSGNDVNRIFEDHEGNLWLATDNGVDLFRNTAVIMYSMDQGMSTDHALTVLPLRDGTIWTGNYDSQNWNGEEPVSLLHAGTDLRFSLGPKVPGRIGALFQDHTDAIWYSYGDSMAVYRDGRADTLLGQDGKLFVATEVTAIIEDSTQSVLALNKKSLLRLRDRNVVEVIPLPRTLGTSGYLAVNPGGGVWIAGQREGVMLYKDGTITDVPLPKSKDPIRIRGAFADATDPLLLASTIGLLRWDGKQWQTLDVAKGLPCARTLGMTKDHHGSLWIQASCGILEAEASDLQRWRENSESRVPFTVFNGLDGAQTGSIRVVQPTMSLAPDGRVWFANARKVGVIDPDRLYRNPFPPPVVVERLVADDKPYSSSQPLHIPPNPRSLEIDYAALNYTVPQRVLFRYFLEGHDKDWQDAVARRQAFYTDLAPGKYRFHVIASNNSGVWNTVGAVTEFVIEPRFYQTLWFRCLLAIAAACGLWALYTRRLRYATAEVSARMGERLRERERIARDLHDTLLQDFQAVILRFQLVANHLGKSDPHRAEVEQGLEYADKVLAEGRNHIRDIRADTKALDGLVESLTLYGEELSGLWPLKFAITATGKSFQLYPIVRDEMYRIGREAIGNAFRHSNGSEVTVEVLYTTDAFILRIRDDGQGMEAAVLRNGRPGHWGISNMRERAQKIGATLGFSSLPNSGTCVELTIAAELANGGRTFWFKRRRRGTNENLLTFTGS